MHVQRVGALDDDVGLTSQPRVSQRRVHAAGCEHAGDGQARPCGEGTIGDDEQLHAAPRGAAGVRGQSRQRCSEPDGTGVRVPGGIEQQDAPSPSVAVAFTTRPEGGPQGRRVGHEWGGQAHGPSPHRQGAQQGRAAAEIHGQIHHDALALGVDGRVGDLREALAKVVGHWSVEMRGGRRGCVVAHRPERLVRLEGHRPDVHALLLGIEAGHPARQG